MQTSQIVQLLASASLCFCNTYDGSIYISPDACFAVDDSTRGYMIVGMKTCVHVIVYKTSIIIYKLYQYEIMLKKHILNIILSVPLML